MKDKESGLPKKYVSGLSKSTAKARAAHWKKMAKYSDRDPRAYEPAPGDKTAKTKLSKYTKKYREMFGEEVDEACWTGYTQKGMKKKGKKIVPNCVPVKESDNLQGTPVVSLADVSKPSDFRKDRYGRSVPKKLKKNDPRVKYVKEEDNSIAAKAKKSGISLSTLKTVYRRGVAAWNSGHRPGTTPQQWGMARVNSYITKGKGTYHGADKDLREEEASEACWAGYKQVGLKKKGSKMVPNCVPENVQVKSFKRFLEEQVDCQCESLYEDLEIVESEYQGKKVELNNPFRTSGGPKKFSVYVKNDKGNVVKVNFGDPNMEIKRDDPNRRASFRARHNCDDPGPKWKARYWSCYQWRAGAKVDN